MTHGPPSTAPRSSPDRLLSLTARWLPAAVLCAVALVQMGMVYWSDLTPWKGGGFGMFSTVDNPAARFVRVSLETDDGTVPAEWPPWLGRDVLRVQTAPSPAQLERLADRLSRLAWVSPPRPDVPQEGEARSLPPMPAQALEPDRPRPPGLSTVAGRTLRVELWRYRFEPRSNRLIARQTLSATAPARPPRTRMKDER